MTRGKSREEKLAELLNIPIQEVFDKIEIPESSFELAARIQKMKSLGLDASKEESIRKARLVEIELNRVKEAIKAEPALLPKQVSKLASLVKGVLDDLQPEVTDLGVERGPEDQTS